MSNINFGGLALAIVTGSLGAVGATLHAGATNGPALSGAALAGAATGIAAFFIHPKTNPDGTALTATQQIDQGLLTVAGVAQQSLPAQAQPAAGRVLDQVAAAASAVPTAANVTSSGPSAEDIANAVTLALATLQAGKGQVTNTAPPNQTG